MTETPEIDNVTSSVGATSRDTYAAQHVEDALVRYLFPLVVFIGKVTFPCLLLQTRHVPNHNFSIGERARG